MKNSSLHVLLCALVLGTASQAQTINPSRGRDTSVDYRSLVQFGPWDDRNYQLTHQDLALLAPNEAELTEAIPAFYRVELRRLMPQMLRSGKVQYPRSALPRFLVEYGGYLIDGQFYRKAERRDGRFVVIQDEGLPADSEGKAIRALTGEARVTSPNDAAESAIAISPVDSNKVIAGSNGPGSGQKMHYSTNGGSSWTQAAALPLAQTCCDPTVVWSSDGSKAYAASLGGPGFAVLVYRSADGGMTWDNLNTEAGANPRRILGSNTDKEFLHLDTYATSPFKDRLYVTWHESNVLKFTYSSDNAHTFAATQTLSSGSDQLGIGSDITSDKNGNVYYFWPAFVNGKIWVRKSTTGGSSFDPAVQVVDTQGEFDFPIPSMETRRVFIYVAADTDRTQGPFANRVYAAWTDSTAATGGVAANNHGRIQVGYSGDGGATWTIKTPHETADANTVDRWHPWLSVSEDGTVHVMFYDTRRDPTRSSVDVFHSYSINGGETWSMPARLTSVQSPNIADGFEFGDYNGLDVVAGNLLAIYTDNRDEGGGMAESVDVYAAGDAVGLVIFHDEFASGDLSAWSTAVP